MTWISGWKICLHEFNSASCTRTVSFSGTAPQLKTPVNEHFYEKVIKVKADVAALLNLFFRR
jgi:hypothetical protein